MVKQKTETPKQILGTAYERRRRCTVMSKKKGGGTLQRLDADRQRVAHRIPLSNAASVMEYPPAKEAREGHTTARQ